MAEHKTMSRKYGKSWRAVCTCGWKINGERGQVRAAEKNHLHCIEEIRISDSDLLPKLEAEQSQVAP